MLQSILMLAERKFDLDACRTNVGSWSSSSEAALDCFKL